LVDEFVVDKILAALEPAGLELCLRAAEELERERARLDKNWQHRLERLHYEAERAHRQYETVEPENRLVARELERCWETSLRQSQELEQEYARFCQAHPPTLNSDERETILTLSKNLPAVWYAATTTSREQQRIVRMLVERVVVHMEKSSNHVDLTVHWVGGYTSQHELVRSVLRYDQKPEYEKLTARITELHHQGLTRVAIANQLNTDGFRPLKGKIFDGKIVSHLLQRLGHHLQGRSKTIERSLQKNEWLVADLAARLKIPKNTFFAWIRRGWVHVVRQVPGWNSIVCWADADELDRLVRLRLTRHGWSQPIPTELTTPKKPSNNQ
jgi:hypothetical protein